MEEGSVEEIGMRGIGDWDIDWRRRPRLAGH